MLVSACQTISTQNDLIGHWQVESIYRGGIIDSSFITIQIDAQQRISGSTGCNNFSSSIQTQDLQFKVDNIALTRKLCAPALNAQEQRFVTALETAYSYKRVEHDWVYVFDESNNRILKLVPMQEDEAENHTSNLRSSTTKQGMSVANSSYFQCKQFGRVSTRLLGPETIELKLDNVAHELTREKSASGTKYAKQSISFWNKADKVMLTVDEIDYACSKSV